ncbi:MAG: agmatinase family protein [Paraglaciecola sp.]|uniref:agmatinase family protein n=1 Tax=Paraglaciecola sp. TaxID=1920173 RepID=UPI003266188C
MSNMNRFIALLLLTFSFLTINIANAKDEKELALPASFKTKVKSIPEEKLDILKSPLPTILLGTMERFYEAMEDKTPAEIEAYLDGMIEVAEASKFNPDTDMATIPLNTETPQFNSWKVERPQSLNPKREPGPIHLSRYMNTWGTGINTFAGAPVAIYPEDLVAGKVDVAIVGAPLDMGSYYRGQRFGPQAMRTGYYSGGVDMNTMINPSSVLSIVDYGDIAIDNMSTEISVHHVRERVREIAETGAIPFIVGGDHSLEYPDIAGLADVHGKGSFGVVHFDSHYDAGKNRPHWITHGQPVYRAVKEGHVNPENFIQVGLRGAWPGPEGFEWMRNNGMRYHTMAEVEKKGWKAVMENALAEAREGGKKLFISFDVDVLDPAFVPGTGTPVPGGLTMREAIPIVRALCTENEMVGFEIVELDPLLDPTYRSALNANFIMHACLTGVAMRHEGITEGDYLSELTTEHMQPEAGIKGRKEGLREEVNLEHAKPQK